MGENYLEMRLPTKEEQEEEEACIYAVQLATFSCLPMMLNTAIELGLLEIIAKAGAGVQLSPSEITLHLPTHNANASVMVDRTLRLLASYSILTCSQRTLDNGHIERLYGLAPVSKFFVKNQYGVSIAPMVLLNQDKVSFEHWYKMKDAVLEGGIPFNMAHGMGAYEYQGADPRFEKVFNTGMSNYSTIILKKIVDTYKGFEGLTSLVDVGGGVGSTLQMIVSKYPSLRGINFDLPHVIAEAPSYPRVENVVGDMFVSVPKGDAILLKWICHNWSDDHCLKFLNNCYDALADDGKVIVIDYILPPTPDATRAAQQVIQYDCIMMAVFAPGAKERTHKEFDTLAHRAGFLGFRVFYGAYNNWILEFLKNPSAAH
ncbi:hypothetical protein NE237_009843 [Protea cynaroides]|uniref:Caffeic acid O-methyltransferase n=1 Tax=Protea cynaroides TaxID=273540 RepID=A0A9Q0R0N8_9MAGN|nr:hypothetical protein NE237_009843 [Protea cynaroides]